MIGELSGHDPARAAVIGRWPLRSTLKAYRSAMIAAAIDEYRHQLLVWAVTAPAIPAKSRPKPPKLPAILKRRGDVTG